MTIFLGRLKKTTLPMLMMNAMLRTNRWTRERKMATVLIIV